jgi:hypothetical protein
LGNLLVDHESNKGHGTDDGLTESDRQTLGTHSTDMRGSSSERGT